MFIDILNQYLSSLNISISTVSQHLLLIYWNFLLDTNKSINLISRQGSTEDRIINHLVDSLSPLSLEWPNNLKVMDLGSGGGLPGIPLKICRPDWDVTLVESKIKKANFLFKTRDLLNLNNLTIINNYIDSNYNFNNIKFDLITVRAVGKINDLIPLIYKFLKVGGIFLVYKGPNYMSELDNNLSIFNKYKIELFKKYTFILPLINAERNIILFKKL
jgi:16S rRNA (guanine527-N7)-methyltransferase